jgi:hypothetical protein
MVTKLGGDEEEYVGRNQFLSGNMNVSPCS